MIKSVVIFLIVATLCCGQTITDRKTLGEDKLRDYDINIRPRFNQSEPVSVTIGMELVSIQEFDEVQQKLTVVGVLLVTWTDDFIQWRPPDYGNITEIVLPVEFVWTPSLVLTNNVEKIDEIGDSWQIVRFSSQGKARFYPGDVFTASCAIDITYYPYDKHWCGFQINAWGHSTEELQLFTDNLFVNYFSENGVWEYMGSRAEVLDNNRFVRFEILLKRKPRFIIVNVILPLVFMSILNVLIFLIPVDSGERVSYSITVLLAVAVLLTLVGDNLPKTSNPMSLLCYYLLATLVLSTCITFANIYSLRLYYRDSAHPVSRQMKSFVQVLVCKHMPPSANGQQRKEYTGAKGTLKTVTHSSGRRNTVSGMAVYSHLGRYFKHNGHIYTLDLKNDQPKEDNTGKNDQDDLEITWQDISNSCDKLFFIFFSFVLTTIKCIFFVAIALRNQT